MAHLELALDHVDVFVEAGSFAPLGDDRQPRPRDAAHEEQHVRVSRFPAGRQSEVSRPSRSALTR